MKLVLATQNNDKIKELRLLVKDLDIEILSSSDFENIPEVIEDKDTLKGNAAKKAIETAQFTKMYCLADDTGLFIESLDFQPGVFSARFAGENCSYKDNRYKVLRLMKDKDNRYAFFQTAVALASPDGEVISVAFGKVEGEITKREIGNKGFGYDSIFRCKLTGKTFAEMDDTAKNKISHRGLAFKNILPKLKEIINS